MRLPYLAPPTRDELRDLRVHELVRDYPELLPFLSPREKGAGGSGTTLLSDDSGSEVKIEELVEILSWREGTRPVEGGEAV